jgi:uncharacterized protein (DUF1697 family)
MTSCVTLLRAANVGAAGELPLTELLAMSEDCGFKDVRLGSHAALVWA